MTKFEIEIVEQHWLEDLSEKEDLCSHGTIRLIIGDKFITNDYEYGIIASAFMLLKTLNPSYLEEPDFELYENLIACFCGQLLISCPMGVNWRTVHENGKVILKNISRTYQTNGESIKFDNLEITLSWEEYAKQIINFAEEAKDFYKGIEKDFDEDFEREEYNEFWKEFEQMLLKNKKRLQFNE